MSFGILDDYTNEKRRYTDVINLTVLEINNLMTKEDFIQLAIEWNQGSPHAENSIQGINWKGERNIRYGTDSLWLAIEEYRNQNIIAIRYE